MNIRQSPLYKSKYRHRQHKMMDYRHVYHRWYNHTHRQAIRRNKRRYAHKYPKRIRSQQRAYYHRNSSKVSAWHQHYYYRRAHRVTPNDLEDSYYVMVKQPKTKRNGNRQA